MKASEVLRVFLLGMAVALLAVLVFRPQSAQTRAADDVGMGAAAEGLIAITGTRNTALYIVDAKEQTVALYDCSASKVQLIATRLFKYDLRLPDWSGKRITPEEAEKEARKQEKEKTK